MRDLGELIEDLEDYLDGLDSVYFSLFDENPADSTIEAAHQVLDEMRKHVIPALLH